MRAGDGRQRHGSSGDAHIDLACVSARTRAESTGAGVFLQPVRQQKAMVEGKRIPW